jgi:predicted GIY-YIG superfamily endonuclease
MKTMYVYILKCSDESYYTGGTRIKKEALIKRDFELLKKLSNHNKTNYGSTGSP